MELALPHGTLSGGYSGAMRPFFFLLFLAFTSTMRAEVRLPHLFSDHAVLQREQPLKVWGWAEPGEQVQITFRKQAAAVTADALGHWSVALRPEPAGGPDTLTVRGTNTLTLHDVLVGDVWFASGQSNMELPLRGFPGSAVLKNGAAEIAAANQPHLRLLRFPHVSSPYEQQDIDAAWTLCTPETATEFSAVAYFFGRALQHDQHVPIGLIDATWGGTPASSWVSLQGLSADAGLMPVFAAHVPIVEQQAEMAARTVAEKREDDAARAGGQAPPKHPWHPDPASWDPTGLFNGMIAPALGYPIKGVLWYQGETDSSTERAPLYARLFPTLISDWRARWGVGDFPFIFAQISSFTSTPGEHWGVIRDAQRRSLKLTETAMAVTLDVGEVDNVHPADKQTVGARLALGARSVAYGEKVEWSGPLFQQVVEDGDTLRVYFTHGEGLTAKSGPLHGFEAAGEDGIFKPAEARIEVGTVVVRAAGLTRPRAVRYAWANSSLEANLYNSAGLPASTFTSERQPSLNR